MKGKQSSGLLSLRFLCKMDDDVLYHLSDSYGIMPNVFRDYVKKFGTR